MGRLRRRACNLRLCLRRTLRDDPGLFHPEELSHLWALAGAGLIGFLGNELAARVRLHAVERLSSPALVADGKHARVDGFVSLGVIASAALVALGWDVGDPIVGLLITIVILKVTWDAWRTIRVGVHGGDR